MRVLVLALGLSLLAPVLAAQTPDRFIPRDADALLRLPSAQRAAELIAADGPFRELFALLPPDQARGLDEARGLLEQLSGLFDHELTVGLRYGLLGKIRAQAAATTGLDLDQIEALLARADRIEQKPSRRRAGGHDLLAYGDALVATIEDGVLLVATGLDDLEDMLAIDPGKSAADDAGLLRLADEAGRADLSGVLRLDRLLKEDRAEEMRADNFVGTLVLEGLRRDLARAERLYFQARLAPDLSLRLRTRGPAEEPDWSSADRPATLLPPLRDELARIRIDRDLAAFWADREELVSSAALPGLAEFSQNLDTLLAGLSTGEFAAALEPGLDLIALEKDEGEAAPRPLLPRFVLAFRLRDDADPELRDRIRVGFQTAIGAINLSAGRERRRPFLQYSRIAQGTEILAARLVGAARAGEVGVAGNFEPALAIVADRLILASDIVGAEQALEALGRSGEETVGGDRLEMDGARIARMLERNREAIEDARMLDEGETPEEAAGLVDRLVTLASSVDRLVFRRLSTARGAVWDLLVRRRSEDR